MHERRQPSGHPDVSTRNVLFFMVLISSLLVQTHQQQSRPVLDTRQPWIQIPFYPTNSVYGLRQQQQQQQQVAPISGNGATGSSSLSTLSLFRENNVRVPSQAKVISHEVNDEEYVDEDYEGDLESEQDPRSSRVHHDYENPPVKHALNHTAHLQTINKNINSKNNSSHQANQHEDPASTQYDSYYYYDDYENDTHSADVSVDYPDPSAIDEKLQLPEAEKHNLEESNKDDTKAINVEIKTSKNESVPVDPKIEANSQSSSQSSNSKIPETQFSISNSSSSISKSEDPQKEEEVEEEEENDEDYLEIDSHSPDENNDNDVPSAKEPVEIATKAPTEESSSSSKSILIGEAVVSVVTTKSVVNGTFSVPVTSSPLITEQISSPPTLPNSLLSSTESSLKTIEITTEDSSRILASVQTSRSISGARFLPFPVIDRVEQFDQSKEEATSKKVTSSESTESIIDKLDRVQSELSNGFLAGGFRNAGNTLQMDEPADGEQTNQKRYSTIKPPGKFVPRRYSDKRFSTTTVTTPTTTVSTTTTTIKSTTSKASTSRFKYQTTLDDLEGLLPKNYPKSSLRRQFPKSTATTVAVTEATTTKSTTPSKSATILEDISAFLPPGFKLKKEDTSTEKSLIKEIFNKSNNTESSLKNSPKDKSISSIHDLFAKTEVNITAFLPPDFKEKKNSTESTNKKPLQDLFVKSSVDVSAFLPKDFKLKGQNSTKTTEQKLVTNNNNNNDNNSKLVQDLFAKSEVDITAFLPKDFNKKKNNSTDKVGDEKTVNSNATPIATTMKTGGIKLVFPSRPGGRKPSAKITTPQPPRGGDGSGAAQPKIQKGWPIRATTEFTGWPTSSTTPISIEKLLEAARTATISSLNISQFPTISEVSSTSTTTTTTTTTPKPTTPGICDDECEVAGTIRIIDNATWVPELLDRNTREWQDLANKVEREMNFVFAKSAVFKKWFKNIRIDAFSQGSILVDYFVELNNLHEGVNTQQLKVIFHDSLRTYNNRFNETKTKGPLKMGMFTIDPKFTDFVVIPRIMHPHSSEHEEKLIPQWAIAVIIIGIGGLLFIIVFGVSVLANRHRVPKAKPPVMAIFNEEKTKNVIQASHAPPTERSSDYYKSDIYSMWNDPGTAWNDKSFESNSNKILVDGSMMKSKKYNMYDSWRSEWNGYHYNPSHSSNKYGGYDSNINLSRHHHHQRDDDVNHAYDHHHHQRADTVNHAYDHHHQCDYGANHDYDTNF